MLDFAQSLGGGRRHPHDRFHAPTVRDRASALATTWSSARWASERSRAQP